MTRSLSKKEAAEFRRRWQLVNAHEEEELRNTSVEVKWQQFNELMRWARAFGWTEVLEEGVHEVRARWTRLREVLGGQKKVKH